MKTLTAILCLPSAVLFAAIWGLSEVPLFETGQEAYVQRDYGTTLSEWKPIAENKGFLATPDGPLCMIGVCYKEEDVTKAQYNLGEMYANGHGVPQADKTAAKWYRLAAERGHADAKERLKELKVKEEKEQDVARGKLVVVTTKNIFEGMVVYKSPHWDDAWGNKSIHPPTITHGKVRSWSDMNGKMHGRYHEDKGQLQWVGLVCVDWNGDDLDPRKSEQAYRIGFADEYWLVGEVSPSLALSNSDCAKFAASAPEAVKGKYIKRCMQAFAEAKNGDVEAAFGLGVSYSREKNYAGAKKWWSLAAEKQHFRSILNLGYMNAYFLKDDIRALMWLNLIKNKKEFQDNLNIGAYKEIKDRMNRGQIIKADKLSNDCIRKKYKAC